MFVLWFAPKHHTRGLEVFSWHRDVPSRFWLWMPQQQNCSGTVAFDSWILCSVALKMCYRHTPKLCCFSVTFSALSSFLCVTELQSNNSVSCQGEFFDTLEGNSSSSSKCLELWLQIFPLEKFLAFIWDKIPVFYDTWDTSFPQQFTGLSWGKCQVWGFWECLEDFYFTAERQFDGLVQKELSWTVYFSWVFCYARRERRL